VIARNKDSVGFVLYSIIEPEIDGRGFTGPLEQGIMVFGRLSIMTIVLGVSSN
jgi:hypothetical protein